MDSHQILTQEARVALNRVKQGLQDTVLFRYKEKEKIALCILSTFLQPTGLLWQEGPLLWVHPRASPAKSIDHYSTAITKLTLLEIQQCLQFFEKNLTSLNVPYTASQVQILCRTINDWVYTYSSLSKCPPRLPT